MYYKIHACMDGNGLWELCYDYLHTCTVWSEMHIVIIQPWIFNVKPNASLYNCWPTSWLLTVDSLVQKFLHEEQFYWQLIVIPIAAGAINVTVFSSSQALDELA